MRKLKQISILLLALLSFSCFSIANPNKAVYLIPEGFTGGVIVLYNQPDGIIPETADDGTIIYRIPKDGFLKVKPPLKKVAYKFNYYFVDAQDKRTEIEYVYPKYYVRDRGDTTSKSLDTINEDERNNGIFAMFHETTNFNGRGEKVYLYRFVISKVKDIDIIFNKNEDKINDIQRSISKSKIQ